MQRIPRAVSRYSFPLEFTQAIFTIFFGIGPYGPMPLTKISERHRSMRISFLPCPDQGSEDFPYYSPREVRAIVALQGQEELTCCLGDVVTAPATSGLRISELSELRRSNADFERG